jgi:hypothetical protein
MVSQSALALSIHLSFSLISDPFTLVFQGERGAVGSKGERVSVCVCLTYECAHMLFPESVYVLVHL